MHQAPARNGPSTYTKHDGGLLVGPLRSNLSWMSLEDVQEPPDCQIASCSRRIAVLTDFLLPPLHFFLLLRLVFLLPTADVASIVPHVLTFSRASTLFVSVVLAPDVCGGAASFCAGDFSEGIPNPAGLGEGAFCVACLLCCLFDFCWVLWFAMLLFFSSSHGSHRSVRQHPEPRHLPLHRSSCRVSFFVRCLCLVCITKRLDDCSSCTSVWKEAPVRRISLEGRCAASRANVAVLEPSIVPHSCCNPMCCL